MDNGRTDRDQNEQQIEQIETELHVDPNETTRSVRPRVGPNPKEWSKGEMAEVWAYANRLAHEAVVGATIVPMTVCEADSTGEPLKGGQSWFIPDGPCGFAWVVVRPATGRFARWLKSEDIGRYGSYERGIVIWISQYNQSVQKKSIHARKLAETLRSFGINAHAYDRMD